jgi:hypothetical protein
MRKLTLITMMALATSAQAEDWLYLTYEGDTLSEIAYKYVKDWKKDWPKVMKHNGVAYPEVLPKNVRIKIPVELLKVGPAPVQTVHVEGNVRVKPEGGSFKPLVAGDQLVGLETVLTGPKSFASFELADGSKINLGPSSKVTFGRLAKFGPTGMVSTEMNLQNGRLDARAAKQLAPAGGFKVATPVAVAGLRGTAFRLNVNEENKTLISEVLEGAVAVDGQGKEVLVKAGTGSIASADASPTAAISLPPAPSLEGLPAKITTFPIHFAWNKDNRATAWRSEVATDVDFQRIVLDQLSNEPAAKWDDTLPDGQYSLRVRMKDEKGLEGYGATHAFELDARPLPPTAVKPADGERSYQESIRFAWAAPEEANGYKLQIATSKDFSTGLIERHLPATTSHDESLVRGNYYWRMASLDDKGVTREWGPAQALQVRPLPNAPGGTSAKVDDGKARLAWSKTAGADAYEVAISPSADLSDAKIHKAQDTSASMEVKPGTYYWKVRGVESDGRGGGWSGVGSFVYSNPPSNLQGWTEGDTVVLTWEGSAKAYRIEFASDQDFKEIFFRHRQEGTRAKLSKPLPEKYWVRVLSLDSQGGVEETGPTLTMSVGNPFPWWIRLPSPASKGQ